MFFGRRFRPHIVPRDDSCEESWSKWQDLLFLCLTTDFPKLFQAVFAVCVPTLSTSK
jgi:hypothetical protein